MRSLSRPAAKVIRAAVKALDDPNNSSGQLVLHDGRMLPTVRTLRDRELLKIEYLGVDGSKAMIRVRATDAARAWVKQNPDVDDIMASYDRRMTPLRTMWSGKKLV